jgi:hypothetical protein
MATDLENLQTAKSNLLARLAEVGHKRNYTIDGQTFDTGELWKRLKMIDEAIASSQGPFELIDRGNT